MPRLQVRQKKSGWQTQKRRWLTGSLRLLGCSLINIWSSEKDWQSDRLIYEDRFHAFKWFKSHLACYLRHCVETSLEVTIQFLIGRNAEEVSCGNEILAVHAPELRGSAFPCGAFSQCQAQEMFGMGKWLAWHADWCYDSQRVHASHVRGKPRWVLHRCPHFGGIQRSSHSTDAFSSASRIDIAHVCGGGVWRTLVYTSVCLHLCLGSKHFTLPWHMRQARCLTWVSFTFERLWWFGLASERHSLWGMAFARMGECAHSYLTRWLEGDKAIVLSSMETFSGKDDMSLEDAEKLLRTEKTSRQTHGSTCCLSMENLASNPC